MWSRVEEELRGLQSQSDQRIYIFFNKALKAIVEKKKKNRNRHSFAWNSGIKPLKETFFLYRKKTNTAVGVFSSPLVIH